MLKSMRRKTITRNIIIGIIVALLASYVLFSFGQAPPKVQGDVIAKLGSSTIKFRDALIQKENLRTRFASLEAEQINQFAASALLSDAVLLHGAKQSGMRVSDEELRDYVVRIRQMLGGEDQYLTNEQWRDWIKYRYQLQVENFEEYLREKEILVQRFRTVIGDSTFLSEDVIRQEYITENTKLDMELVVLNPYVVREQVSMTDEELRAYYDENPDMFMSGDQRQIRFVSVTKKDFQDIIVPEEDEIVTYYEDNQARFKDPEKADVSHIMLTLASRTEEEARQRLEDIREEIQAGLDFVDAAQKYSEHNPTKGAGGKIGVTPKGQLIRQFGPEFENVTFSIDIGDVSEPTKSRLGIHLIRVDERIPESFRPLDECRDLIVRTLKRTNGIEQARQRATEFLTALKAGKEFEALAAEMEMPVNLSNFFDDHNQSNLGEALGQNGRVRQKVFQLEQIGDLTEVVDSGAAFVVAEWVAEKEAGLLPFDTNLARIRETTRRKRSREFILETMNEIKNKVAGDASLTLRDACTAFDFISDNAIKQTGQFSAETVPADLTVPEIDYQGDLFNLEQGEFVGPMGVRNDALFLLGRVTEKVSADMEQFKEQRLDIVRRLRGESEIERLTLYSEAMRDKLDPNQQTAAKVQATLSRF